jgi:hypothetical protein
MADPRPKLRKLVALKRQKAEQTLAIVQMRLRDLSAELDALQREFTSADRAGGDIQALMLASRNGHAKRMLWEMDRKRTEIAEMKLKLQQAREDLKLILNSEDQLSRMDVKS